MPSVIIGPEFFKKEFNEYDNWRWAWVREICQNSIDAGSGKISFEITEEGDHTVVTVTNDGTPMTEDIIVNKLLALGASGKNFAGTTGGFGKAKNILLFCHQAWSVKSGITCVSGVGGEYDITKIPHLSGTMTTVTMEGHQRDKLIEQLELFIKVAQWSGVFVINGSEHTANLKKGSPRRDLGFGKVFTNKSIPYRMIVRINGVPMFITRIGLDRCVIVELTGTSDQVMTSNRDGLLYQYRNELSDFVTELSVDKRSALKDRSRGPKYIQYRGTKLCHKQALDVSELVVGTSRCKISDEGLVDLYATAAGGEVAGGETVHDSVLRAVGTAVSGGVVSLPLSQDSVERSVVATIGTNFLIKNETDLKVPAYYDPGSGEFSSYSKKLVRSWGRIMLELHRMFDTEAEFSIGFIFDDSAEAEFEQGDFGKVYFLNPCKIVTQGVSYSKSFKKRFQLTERDRLIMIGLHEFVHCLGFGWHDERYAGKLTDLAAVVMRERKRFNWCFK